MALHKDFPQYSSALFRDDIPPSPDDDNMRDYFLGKRPTGATTDSKVDMGMIVRDIDELMVLYCQLSQSALLDPHPNPPPLGEGA